jgi:hypothetical protein
MTKKRTTSTDTTPAPAKARAAAPATPRPRTAKKSAAETAPAAAQEPVARHRRATPVHKIVQPEVAEAPVPVSISITQDDIAQLAFSYFERRGYQGGSPEEDWLRAEEELLQMAG